MVKRNVLSMREHIERKHGELAKLARSAFIEGCTAAQPDIEEFTIEALWHESQTRNLIRMAFAAELARFDAERKR